MRRSDELCEKSSRYEFDWFQRLQFFLFSLVHLVNIYEKESERLLTISICGEKYDLRGTE